MVILWGCCSGDVLGKETVNRPFSMEAFICSGYMLLKSASTSAQLSQITAYLDILWQRQAPRELPAPALFDDEPIFLLVCSEVRLAGDDEPVLVHID